MSSIKYHYIAVVKIVHSCKIGKTENCKCTEMLIVILLHADLQEDRSYRWESGNYIAIDFYTTAVAQLFQTFFFHCKVSLAVCAQRTFPENGFWPQHRCAVGSTPTCSSPQAAHHDLLWLLCATSVAVAFMYSHNQVQFFILNWPNWYGKIQRSLLRVLM